MITQEQSARFEAKLRGEKFIKPVPSSDEMHWWCDCEDCNYDLAMSNEHMKHDEVRLLTDEPYEVMLQNEDGSLDPTRRGTRIFRTVTAPLDINTDTGLLDALGLLLELDHAKYHHRISWDRYSMGLRDSIRRNWNEAVRQWAEEAAVEADDVRTN